VLKKKNYKKIFLVGNKSFLQENLFKNLKIKNMIKIRFNKMLKVKASEDDLVINFSNHINFYKKKYNQKYDRNLILAKFLGRTKAKFIMLSSRQVYKAKMNITENSNINPISTYGKNCYQSEINCKKFLYTKLLVLRLTNIIGYENRIKKRQSLMSAIINGYKQGLIKFDNNYYLSKDLLPVKQFSEIFKKIIKSDINGVYNIGTGKSIKVNLFIKKIMGNKKIKINIDKKKKILDNNFSINPKKLFNLISYTFTEKMLSTEINNLKKKFN